MTWSRRLSVAAVLLGGVAAVGVAADRDADLVAVQAAMQSAMSVLVPFTGVLAVRDLHDRYDLHERPEGRLRDRLLRAGGLAVALSLVGTATAVVVTVALRGEAGPGRTVLGLAAAAALVQLVAQLTGTGCGLVLRRPVVAMAATVVVPLGVYALLGVLDPGGTAQAWLTPFGTASTLLAGEATAGTVAQVAVVVLLWNVVPNAAGAWRVDALRRDPPRPAPTG